MKTLLTLLVSLFLASPVWAGNGGESSRLLAPKTPGARTFSPQRAQLNRGPFQTMSVKHQGLALKYQEAPQGANWAELSGGRVQWSEGALRVSAAPTIFLNQEGKAGVGADIRVQLSHLVKVNHSSHLGAAQRHQTRILVAPDSPLGIQLMRVGGVKGVVTRVGPSVKLGKGLRLWHGVATDDSHDLTLVTGNVRF